MSRGKVCEENNFPGRALPPLTRAGKWAILGLIQVHNGDCREEVSFPKPVVSEREMVQALSQRREAAALEQPVKSGTTHPRYRMT